MSKMEPGSVRQTLRSFTKGRNQQIKNELKNFLESQHPRESNESLKRGICKKQACNIRQTHCAADFREEQRDIHTHSVIHTHRIC